MINFQKKQVKIISVIIAAVFIFSIVALGVSQYQSGMAGASSSNVGVVDYSQLISQHPGMQAARDKYEEAAKQVQDEFTQKAGSMTPEEQQQFIEQKQKEMQDKQKELIDPIRTSIENQVQEVAASRSINVVLDKNNVLYGGQDITQEVLKKIQAEGDVATDSGSTDTAAPATDAPADNANSTDGNAAAENADTATAPSDANNAQ